MKALDCHILKMLRAQKRHISFHTPGHKRSGQDITELDYSDNLADPHGVIARAEEDVARILGAEKSFLLTDGSTCGVLSVLYALKTRGVKRVACPPESHVSVKNGCRLLGLERVDVETQTRGAIPQQPTAEAAEKALAKADALLLTSPDYYGNIPDLAAISRLCRAAGKPFAIDGAHGAHLHFTPLHAGRYADLWVDGAHKSLPALTQGAVVSAHAGWSEALGEGVSAFRTTSPSYPIMASVEYAIKYPRNEAIERAAAALKGRVGAYGNGDWSKIVLPFGEYSDMAQAYLQAHGVYPEFNDGNYLMFYLSPCTKAGELKKLEKLLSRLPHGEVRDFACSFAAIGEKIEFREPLSAVGMVCARECGIFPPCIPLLRQGERVSAEKAKRLARAKSAFGLKEGKILVYSEE